MRYKMAGVLLLLPLFLFVCLVPLISHVTIRSREGILLQSIRLEKNLFYVTFKHSVNKGQVIEIYTVNPKTNSFYLSEGKFENFGAGMLDDVPKDAVLRYDNTFLVITFQKKGEQSQVLYGAAGIANHLLCSGLTCVSLYDINPNKTSVISIEKRSILDTIVNYFQ